MRKHIAAIIASTLALSVTHTVIAQHSHREHIEQEKMQNYTCPMHPEVITDQPGNCPKCGMKLVPMKEKKRSTSNAVKARGAHGALRVHRPTSNEMQMSHPSHSSHASHEMHPPSVAAATSGAAGMEMHSTIDLADPMNREASGTSWIPDSSPMYGRMFMFGDDMLMLHGAIFPRYTNVSTRRGDDRIDAPNW